ncbi:MAG: hypothetical protein MUC49_14605 [Raineya sp.]|jgi:hypothetical protein|nr:hypothetical protein [Raineya sp.]
MINLYCTLLNINLLQIKNIIEAMFPDNTSSIVESGTFFLSDGNFFECSVEPSYFSGYYLSATYDTSLDTFQNSLSDLKEKIEASKGIYDIDYEIEEENSFISFRITHNDFYKWFIHTLS